MLTLELEFVKKGTKSEQVDAALLSTQLKRKYTNQVEIFLFCCLCYC
jgi:vesicle-fusing ATPase